MITIDLMGGLGNQLFQIFFILNLFLEKKISFYFPFSKNDLVSPLDNSFKRPTYWETIFHSLKIYLKQFEPSYKTIHEIDFKFTDYSNINLEGNNLKFMGYFQSYKYFEKNFENIIKFLKIKENKNKVKNLYSKYFENKCASIHFRIGDYKVLPSYHPILPIKYYIQSIKELLKFEKIRYILYFGEEVNKDEINNNISLLQKEFKFITFIECDYNIPDWEQILLMSCCNHNIIANSTFSWWGAYFNDNLEKKIFYPNIWFGPAINKDTEDLFPENWNKITV